MGQGNVQVHPFGPGLDKDKWTDGKEQYLMEKYKLRLEGTKHFVLCLKLNKGTDHVVRRRQKLKHTFG